MKALWTGLPQGGDVTSQEIGVKFYFYFFIAIPNFVSEGFFFSHKHDCLLLSL